MNGKYEVIRQFVAAHGGRAELIEHETAIVDLTSGAQVFDINQAAATYIVEARGRVRRSRQRGRTSQVAATGSRAGIASDSSRRDGCGQEPHRP